MEYENKILLSINILKTNIMTNEKLIRRVIAVLNLPRGIAALISYVRGIILAMTGNTNFTTPSPTLAVLTADVNALDAAESLAHTKAKGTAEARNAKKETLLKDLHALLAYVQIIADNNPTNAEAIILSSGMGVRKTSVKHISDFKAINAKVSGNVMLSVKAANKRASYEWQISTDQETWTFLPVTLQAKTLVSGLSPGTRYYFRYKSVLREGESGWSHVESVIVL
jgi:hypothetical protein